MTERTCDQLIDPNECTGRCAWYLPPDGRKNGWCSLDTTKALEDIAPLCRRLEKQVHPTVLAALKADLAATGTLTETDDSDLCTELSKSIVAYGFLRQFGRSEGEIRTRIRQAQSSWAHRFLPGAFGFHTKDIDEYVRDVDRLFVELDRKYAGAYGADQLAQEALDLISGQGLGPQAHRSLWTYVLGGTFLLSLVALAAWVGSSSSSLTDDTISSEKPTETPPSSHPERIEIPPVPTDQEQSTETGAAALIFGGATVAGISLIGLRYLHSKNEQIIGQANKFIHTHLKRYVTELLRWRELQCSNIVPSSADTLQQIQLSQRSKNDSSDEQIRQTIATYENKIRKLQNDLDNARTENDTIRLMKETELKRTLQERHDYFVQINLLHEKTKSELSQNQRLAEERFESERRRFTRELKNLKANIALVENQNSEMLRRLDEEKQSIEQKKEEAEKRVKDLEFELDLLKKEKWELSKSLEERQKSIEDREKVSKDLIEVYDALLTETEKTHTVLQNDRRKLINALTLTEEGKLIFSKLDLEVVSNHVLEISETLAEHDPSQSCNT